MRTVDRARRYVRIGIPIGVAYPVSAEEEFAIRLGSEARIVSDDLARTWMLAGEYPVHEELFAAWSGKGWSVLITPMTCSMPSMFSSKSGCSRFPSRRIRRA